MLLALSVFFFSQQPLDLTMDGRYQDAVKSYQDLIAVEANETKLFRLMIDLGDTYYDKLGDYDQALQTYQDIVKKFPRRKDLYLAYYRIGQVLELKENYLDAARAYEIVATQYRNAPYDSFALEGVERSFKKNYQDSVAKVDGYRITRLEYDERIAALPPFGKEEYEKQEGKQRLVDQMVMERLLWTSALKENVPADTAVVNKIADAKRRILIDEVNERDITRRAVPTEKQLRQYFVQHRNDYRMPEDVHAKEIVVKNETLALAILDTLRLNPGLWDTLARRYSTATTKEYGGDMGYVTRGSRQVEIESLLFRMKPNQTSNVTKIYEDYGIYRLLEKRPARYRSYKDARTDVEYRLKGELRDKVDKTFVDGLRKSAEVKIILKGDTLAYRFGRYVMLADLLRRQEREPLFARIDTANAEDVKKYVDQMLVEDLKLRFAEQNKYFIYDGIFKKIQELRRREYEGGLYQKVVVEQAVVSDSEIKDYYNKNLDNFKIPEQVKIREIVVPTEMRARQIIEQMRYRPWYFPFTYKYRLDQFDTLAKQFSTAPSREVGGETPFFARGYKPAAVESVAFKMKPNTLSGVIKTGDSSFTIVKLDERKPGSVQTVDEAKSKIEWTLRRQKQIDLANSYLEKIKKEAKIEIWLPPDEPKPEEEKSDTGKPEEQVAPGEKPAESPAGDTPQPPAAPEAPKKQSEENK